MESKNIFFYPTTHNSLYHENESRYHESPRLYIFLLLFSFFLHCFIFSNFHFHPYPHNQARKKPISFCDYFCPTLKSPLLSILPISRRANIPTWKFTKLSSKVQPFRALIITKEEKSSYWKGSGRFNNGAISSTQPNLSLQISPPNSKRTSTWRRIDEEMALGFVRRALDTNIIIPSKKK